MRLNEARKLRSIVEIASASLDDKTASESACLFPCLKYDGSLVKSGTRINWKGTIKRAAVAMWDTTENNPENAPNLWEDILYKDGFRIIPDVITAGTAFAQDECGWWDGVLYRSIVSANVYTPEQYAPNWERVEVQE